MNHRASQIPEEASTQGLECWEVWYMGAATDVMDDHTGEPVTEDKDHQQQLHLGTWYKFRLPGPQICSGNQKLWKWVPGACRGARPPADFG